MLTGIVFDGGLSCRNKLIIMSQVSKQTIARVSGLLFAVLVCGTVSSPHPSFPSSPCLYVSLSVPRIPLFRLHLACMWHCQFPASLFSIFTLLVCGTVSSPHPSFPSSPCLYVALSVPRIPLFRLHLACMWHCQFPASLFSVFTLLARAYCHFAASPFSVNQSEGWVVSACLVQTWWMWWDVKEATPKCIFPVKVIISDHTPI